ncbi:MAG: 50S ribosomal protein L23 [Bacteroidota bacterium]
MNVIIKPLITEKMTIAGEKFNRYGFIVHKRANKLQIKQAIEELYGVTVCSVNTMIRPGKSKIKYTKTGVLQGRTNAIKKAIIEINQGETIDFYSNI